MFKTQDISNMTVKKYLWLLIIVIPINVFSQSKALKKADVLFDSYDYRKALNHYQKLEAKGESRYYVTRRIADCYRLLHMPVLAADWYEKAIDFPDVEAETYYHLGLSLRTLKRYDESEQYISRYHSLSRTQPMQRGLNSEDYLLSILADSARVEIYSLDINSGYSEFGPAICNNQLIFSSNRPGKSFVRHRDARNNQPFFDLYSVALDSLTTTSGIIELFLPYLKSGLNDGPVSFTADGEVMYITLNAQKDTDGKSDLDIMVARSQDGKWDKELSKLPLKMKGFSIAHPSISSDDQRLFFASDMPGGYGGMDIYYSERKGGFLSQPVNLGPHINTPGNEVFPNISSDGRLFFASNGHPGLGGLDICVALPIEGGFSESFNLGPGINSPYDDFSFFPNEDGRTGYFSSNRPGGRGSDDIYAFKFVKPLLFTIMQGTIKNNTTGLPEPDVMINVLKNDGAPVASFKSDEKGNFTIHLLRDRSYNFSFRKRLMEPLEKEIVPAQLKDYSKLNIVIEMQPR